MLLNEHFLVDSTKSVQDTLEKKDPPLQLIEKKDLQSMKSRQGVLLYFLNSKKKLIFIILLIFSSPFIYKKAFELKKSLIQEKNQSIRSNLSLPPESAFLHRQNLIQEMDSHLNNAKEIQSIALVGVVGMGGVGKTTLARYYGRLKKESSIVWELNAETKEALISSFENLASAAAKTQSQREELITIQNIAQPEEKEKKLLDFAQRLLKNCPGWLLIYDNVENFFEIKDYFPQDANVWGSGKVIITTRDATIQHNGYINLENIIDVGELDSQEAVTLFSKILYNVTPDKLTNDQKAEALQFLKNIPSFPLDVSIAAHYIKITQMTYEQYLQKIRGFSEDFEKSQRDVIKETSVYSKTRYGIITLSLKTLIQKNSNFKDLLLFVCFLDSQDIPVNLLTYYKKHSIVAKFFEELKRNGFITNEIVNESQKGIGHFSIHRSVQKIGLSYLIKTLDLRKSSQLTQSIIRILENYIANIMEKEDVFEMKFLRVHYETALTKKELLTAEMTEILSSKLGELYYSLCHYGLALTISQKALSYFSKNQNKNFKKIAEILICIGNVYRALGDYPKAKQVIEQSSAIYRTRQLENDSGFAVALWSFSNVYKELGDYEKARMLLEQSIEIYKKYHPENQHGLLRSMAYLGNIYRELGQYEKAKKLLKQSIAIYKKYYPENHSGLVRSMSYLGNVYLRLGNYEKAKKLLEQSLEIYRKYYPESHIEVAWVLTHLGNAYRKLENYEMARNLLEQSLLIYKKHHSDNHMSIAWALTYLGNVYKELGNYKKAKEILKNCLRIYEKILGKAHIETARILRNLGQVYILENKIDTAEKFLNKALSIFRKHKHADIHLFLESLGELYVLKYQYAKKENKIEESAAYEKKAMSYLNEALSIIKARFSEASPHFIKIQRTIMEIKGE